MSSAPTVFVVLPLRTVSEANGRSHWAAKAKRTKAQRLAARFLVGSKLTAHHRGASALVVTLTRIAPSGGLDSDNLTTSMKAVRDGIADALGVDDGSDAVEWRYAQRRGKAREYAVEVLVSQPRGGVSNEAYTHCTCVDRPHDVYTLESRTETYTRRSTLDAD